MLAGRRGLGGSLSRAALSPLHGRQGWDLNRVAAGVGRELGDVCGVCRPCSWLPQQEAMLKALQRSVEEEEQVWKARVSAAEEELREVRCPRHPGSAYPCQAARTECLQCQGDAHRVIWVTWGGQVLVTPHEVWLQKDSTAEPWSPGDPTPRKRGWSLWGAGAPWASWDGS